MVGFVFAAVIANYFAGVLTWRFAFQVQAIGELPIALCFFFQDNKKIDVLADQKESSLAVIESDHSIITMIGKERVEGS